MAHSRQFHFRTTAILGGGAVIFASSSAAAAASFNSNIFLAQSGGTISSTGESPFYATSWFFALCAFVAMGIVIFLTRVRTRRSRKREAELDALVQERSREIQAESEKTERALEEALRARNEIESYRERAQTLLQELKAVQEKLMQSEKMASLGQLAAGIAHEIKNPLNFVNNFALLSIDLIQEFHGELAKHSGELDPASLETLHEILTALGQNVSKINEHGKRADSIVKGMLLHSRGKSGERISTDINALLAEYINLAYHGLRAQDPSFNVKIESSYDPAIGKMDVVPQNLSRAFLNIINNGCYSAFEKKKSKGDGFSPTISVSTKRRGDKAEVRIRDNGNGVPKHVLDKIFDPFFTTKPTGVGTGLGLSLTRDIIVQEHKGEIHVNTQEGQFAEFIISLPYNGS